MSGEVIVNIPGWLRIERRYLLLRLGPRLRLCAYNTTRRHIEWGFGHTDLLRTWPRLTRRSLMRHPDSPWWNRHIVLYRVTDKGR